MPYEHSNLAFQVLGKLSCLYWHRETNYFLLRNSRYLRISFPVLSATLSLIKRANQRSLALSSNDLSLQELLPLSSRGCFSIASALCSVSFIAFRSYPLKHQRARLLEIKVLPLKEIASFLNFKDRFWVQKQISWRLCTAVCSPSFPLAGLPMIPCRCLG